jgi:long-chain fatty acid transport protein
MNKVFNRFSSLVLVFGLCLVGNAFATNGYFTHGTGTKNKAMAGGGIALPEDAIDVVNNPAVVTEVGDQLVFGAALFSPYRNYSTTPSLYNGQCDPQLGCAFTIGPNNLDSESNYFVIPHIAKSWQLETTAPGPGVLWPRRHGHRMGRAPRPSTRTAPDPRSRPCRELTARGHLHELQPGFFDITWAKKLDNGISLGVAAVLAAQMFKLEGVASFAGFTRTFAASGGTQMPTALSNNGTDWAYGAGVKLGMHAPLSDRVSLGLMYQSEIWMSEFDDYADLFAEQGDMDIPANFKADSPSRQVTRSP